MIARRIRLSAVVALLLLAMIGATPARAQSRVTVGLYAPTAPFIGPSQRLEYITRLAEHLAEAAPGRRVVGRVFADATSFAAAVNRGDVQFAVIDAPYAAARGLPYRVLASAVRDNATAGGWMLVAKPGVSGLVDLRGKTLALPRVGVRAASFVANVLFEGEVGLRYFGALTLAPDAHSAVTLVGLGRAAAAVVPEGVALSRGVRKLVSLRRIGWPMFVAMRNAGASLRAAFGRRVLSFSGRNIFAGFATATAASYQALRASFAPRKHLGPMAIAKPSKLAVSGLMAGRKFRIRVMDISKLAGEQ